MADFSAREYHIQLFVDAVALLENEGEVWFCPGNNGDLGSVMVGDQHVSSIRTYIRGYDG